MKKQQAQLALEEEQRKNVNLLRRQQSAYRAKLGGGGIGAQSGTGRATLNAMQKEYDIEDKYLVNQANVSLDALLNSINQKTTRNLLALGALSDQTTNAQIQNLSGFSSGLGRTLLK